MGQIAEAARRVVDRTFVVLKLIIGWAIFVVVAAVLLRALFFPPTATDLLKAATDAKARGDSAKAARQEKDAQVLLLCEQAAACKKYNAARLECATAGNLKTCLRIKMGDDDPFTNICSGYDPGAPARTLPPNTPNVVKCFFERVFMSF